MILKTVNVGERVLRQKARPLKQEEIRSTFIGDLVLHMRDTMRDALGVGLAAPQIGEAMQLIVIEFTEEYLKRSSEAQTTETEHTVIPFHAMFNPTIELLGPADVMGIEGCLSLPGFVAAVPRAAAVRVHCLNEYGKSQTIEASGFYARILQHEIDHLNGQLYIDRMQSETFSTVQSVQRHGKK